MKKGELHLNTLLIDTSSEFQICAVKTGDNIVNEVIDAGNKHSAMFLSSIDAVIKKAKINQKEISRLICGIGPGSFTGIRIAVSTARMLSQILNIPVMGIPSQMIFSMLTAEEGETVLSAFDAKKNRIFAACYTKTNSMPVEIIKPGDYYPDDIQKMISGKTISATGNGALKYKEILGINYREFNPLYFDDLFKYAEKNSDDFLSWEKLLPFYARKSDAEVLKNSK
ncbi:MAG: tRNA (adenosine(37)-N6)-threonylcarbamoyltransferase complex dimerization subunit type 1 TsaB [Spirochaetes bacterium]|nr:tRNA (adenosine(37)-N6)-threonylcarbamoyltransferase complex dimerization subunit type 1 TsaB [Spirochaetota bacterium]